MSSRVTVRGGRRRRSWALLKPRPPLHIQLWPTAEASGLSRCLQTGRQDARPRAVSQVELRLGVRGGSWGLPGGSGLLAVSHFLSWSSPRPLATVRALYCASRGGRQDDGDASSCLGTHLLTEGLAPTPRFTALPRPETPPSPAGPLFASRIPRAQLCPRLDLRQPGPGPGEAVRLCAFVKVSNMGKLSLRQGTRRLMGTDGHVQTRPGAPADVRRTPSASPEAWTRGGAVLSSFLLRRHGPVI